MKVQEATRIYNWLMMRARGAMMDWDWKLREAGIIPGKELEDAIQGQADATRKLLDLLRDSKIRESILAQCEDYDKYQMRKRK